MRNALLRGSSRLKLGLFAANCSSGTAATKIPGRWEASWENNLALAKLADRCGIDFMLPLARWRGYGGETDFEGETLETITWAGGLLAHTEKLNVFGTVHAPMIHPVFAAKQCVTVDLVGQGRFGLNIVCGWNQDEFEMFGIPQRDHDERYVFGQEWWDVISRIWKESGPFDHDGAYFKLKGVRGSPKPWGQERPMLMNAGSSGAGRSFAARNCDVMFTALIDHERAKKNVAEIKSGTLRDHGRKIGVFTSGHVVCRPTRKEAEEYYQWYAVENADEEAVSHLMKMQGLHAQSFPPDVFAKYRTRFAGGHGSLPIVGTPDEVADEFERIADDGFDGLAFTMVNYLEQMPYFVQEVMPRLAKLGLH